MSEIISYPVHSSMPRKSLNRICDKTGAEIQEFADTEPRGPFFEQHRENLRVNVPKKNLPVFIELLRLLGKIWECYWKEGNIVVFKNAHGFLHVYQEQELVRLRADAKKLEQEFEEKLK